MIFDKSEIKIKKSCYKKSNDFKPLMPLNKEQKITEIAKAIYSIFESEDSNKTSKKPSPAPKPKSNQKLLDLCLGTKKKEPEEAFLAHLKVPRGLEKISFADQKNTLINVTGLKAREFTALTRNPSNGTSSFLITQGALLKYLENPPHPDAARIVPWSSVDYSKQLPLAATVFSKVEAYDPSNKVFKKVAEHTLSALRCDDAPLAERYVILEAYNAAKTKEFL